MVVGILGTRRCVYPASQARPRADLWRARRLAVAAGGGRQKHREFLNELALETV
jgi:hypothetical protein